MSGGTEQGDQLLLKGGVCQVECIIVDDGEDAEEDVLFVNVGCSSVSSQTDPQYLDTFQANIPGVPIFYCGQPSPGTANTQCLIPHLADACVGTEPPGTCYPRSPHKLAAASTGVPSASSVGDVAIKTKTVTLTRNETTPDLPCKGPLPATPAADARTATHSLPASTHRKRGRKRKVLLNKEERSPSSCVPSSSSFKISGKRRRRRKRDDDFEYDLGDSGGEAHQTLVGECDDTDEDWRLEKEQSDEGGEERESPRGKNLGWKGTSEVSPVPDLKDECGDEEANYKTLIDKVAKYEASMEEYDDDDGDEYGCREDMFSSSANHGGSKNEKVLPVGINDLDPKSTASSRLRKYSEKAKQKYRQEKVVREDGRVVYRCLKCTLEFELRLQLKEHRKVHAAKARTYECSHCDRVFTEARKYYSHLGLHERIFECQTCGRQFSLLGNLKKHLGTHRGAPDQVCGVCGQQFSTCEQLRHHSLTQHQNDSVREYRVECQHCGKKYVREEAYRQHLSGAPYRCSLCEVSAGCETRLKTHVRNQHGRCVCEFCGKSFKKNSLVHHIKIVHGEACVPCPHCPKKFTYRSKMLAHLDANHSQEKKYKCGLCGYAARTVNTLNLHRRRRHQDPAPPPQYSCKFCTRKFHLPSKLTLHYRVHTGEKPFPCQSCGKAFATKYNRAEHERCVHGERMLLHHPDGSSSVRVVKHRRALRAPGRRCELCGLDLPTSWAMVTHMKEQHNAQTLPNTPLGEDAAAAALEAEEGEVGAAVGEYEVNGGECEAVEDSGEQDLLLAAAPGVVSIPEYATHVEIDGVEYQVLRQGREASQAQQWVK